MTTDDWDDSPAVDDNVSEISTNSATLDRSDFMSRSDDERPSCYDIGLLANGDAMTDDTRRQLLAGPIVSDRSFSSPRQMVVGTVPRGKSSSAD